MYPLDCKPINFRTVDDIYEIIGKYTIIYDIEDENGQIHALVAVPENQMLEGLMRELSRKGYIMKVDRDPQSGLYMLSIMKLPEEKEKFPWVNLILFILTIFTTMMAGAFQQGVNPFQGLNILKGIPFSFSIMSILLAHEMGHYLMSKKHGVRATLPYFIPFPHPLIGTMGALIKIKSPIPDRKALLEIGAAGPWAGMVVAIPITIVGLMLSEVVPVQGQEGLYLGNSLLFALLSKIIAGPIPPGHDLYLHPMAFAGWLGFFVTSLNLIPMGQLDGGHVIYSLLGKKYHRIIARITWVSLVIAGIIWWKGWLTWAIIGLILGLDHPEPLNDHIPLTRNEKIFAIASIILFIITFIPNPIVVKGM